MKVYPCKDGNSETCDNTLCSWNYVKSHGGIYFDLKHPRFEYINIGFMDDGVQSPVILYERHTSGNSLIYCNLIHSSDIPQYRKLKREIVFDTRPISSTT